MTVEHVLISYQAPSAFLISDYWKQIRTALACQLPLRNLHWKSPSRSIRTIQELDVDFVPLDSLHDEHASQVPATLLEKPLLNVYIVVCEDTDFDAYKNTIKKQVKDWHGVVTSRKHQEWIILHLVRPDARTPSGNFFQMKYSVFERIKTDFNSEKKDRCAQLTWSASHDNPAVWADLINKIKDGLLLAFESAVSQREEDVRRSESQRQMPGWNFCTFFILKESLAASYEGLGLFEAAFTQYGELEASFQQVLKEKNSSWFGTLIQPGPKDDSSPLLATDKKPYRDLILANTISVFDLRSYILARQCNLLRKLGRINDLGRRVVSFLSAFGRRLRGDETPLPRFFVESWIYSSCLSTVEQYDAWTDSRTLEGSVIVLYNASKGELLELALSQLEIIGIGVGHLPLEPPFLNTYTSRADNDNDSAGYTISNTELLASIHSQDKFDRTYVDITNRAIDMYARAGRRKFALKLHARLAAIDLHRGRLDAARATFASLPSHYAPHMWSTLEAYMLCRALHAHSQSMLPSGRDWVSLVLSFFKLCVDESGMALFHDEAPQNMIPNLMVSLSQAALTLDPDLVYPDHPGIQIKVIEDAKLDGLKDGAFLDVLIHNKFPCSIPRCEIVAVIVGRESEIYRFVADVDAIPSGKTTLTLFSPSAPAGIYLLDFTELRLSGLVMQWPLKKSSSKSSRGLASDQHNSIPVRIPFDRNGLNVRLAQPNFAKLGETPRMLLVVSSGRNDLSEITLKLTGVSGVSLFCRETTVPSLDQQLMLTEDTITVHGISKESEVEFTIPYKTTTASDTIRVTVGMSYTTLAEPTMRRALQMTRALVTPLPLVVNVQDYFRGSKLFSKFTMSATTHQSIRIASVELKSVEGGLNASMIRKASYPKHHITTVTPTQPANYLFRVDLSAGHVTELLHLVITYRLLREEVELLVDQAVNSVINDPASAVGEKPDPHGVKDQIVSSLSRSSTWVGRYCTSGQVQLPACRVDASSGVFHEVLKALSSRSFDLGSPTIWRELVIPVDVPRMNIIASVELSLPAAQFNKPRESSPLYAGQPVPMSVTIHTTFGGFGCDMPSASHYALQYDIAEMTSDWLLSGQKRGEFKAGHDSSFTTSITLVALHHGELGLPKVSIQALPLQGRSLQASTPSIDVHQIHGASKVLVLPRGGRSTFVIEMGS